MIHCARLTSDKGLRSPALVVTRPQKQAPVNFGHLGNLDLPLEQARVWICNDCIVR